MAASNGTILVGPDGRQGWTQSPDGRGTMTIIWSCLITMGLTCWTSLVVNPHEPKSRFALTLRKLFLTVVGIAAPEAIFQVAMAQWAGARKATQLFHERGFKKWTLRHSFFADMGALHVKFPDEISFPVNSQQLLWLVEKGYVEYPQIDEDMIKDRNKVDGTLRVLTVLQTLWFMINLIARIVQGLTITALELSTAAFVFLNVGTTIFWYKKPADVTHHDEIVSTTSLATIHLKEGFSPDVRFTYTPLDFIGREEWSWTILWSHGLNVARKVGLARQPESYPQQRISNTFVPKFNVWGRVAVAVVTLLYFSIYLLAWNFDFPTTVEKTLWRAASIIMVASVSIIWWVMQISMDWRYKACRKNFESQPKPARLQPVGRPQVNRPDGPSQRPLPTPPKPGRMDRFWHAMKNNSPSQAAAFNVSPFVSTVCYVFGFLYVMSRVWIFLEDIIELRSLPSSAYKSVNWVALGPFIL